MSNNAAIEVALSGLTSNLIVEGTKTTVIVGAGASAPVAKPTRALGWE